MQLAKTLSSYIARQFFAWFCGVFAAMVVVTFLLDYIELIRRSGTRMQATLWVLLEMAALKLPHTAQEVLPFAVLFGTMLAFWRLTRNHELVVARAAGVSVWQFLTPALLVALLIGIVAVTMLNPVASLMEAAYREARKPHPAPGLRRTVSLRLRIVAATKRPGRESGDHPRRETCAGRADPRHGDRIFLRRSDPVHFARRWPHGKARARAIG